MKEPKPKRCKSCDSLFLPRSSFQKACGVTCAMQLLRDNPQEVAKAEKQSWQKEKKERREKLKTTQDYLQLLQVVFNKFIRLRDREMECVSCGQNMQGKKGDASHFYSVGSYPNLRFDERNVNLSCVFCNQHKGGNLLEYAIRLPLRIGQQSFNELSAERQKPLKLTIPEIQEKIAYYKSRIKELEVH